MIAPKAESGNSESQDVTPNDASDQQEQLAASDSPKCNDSPTSTDSPPPSTAEAPRPLSLVEALDLIPVRMLNEFTYCPRLGYLEFVHDEWEDNLETKQGTFGHRRVDKPDRKNVQQPQPTDQGKTAIDSSGQRKPIAGEDSPTSTDSPTPPPAEASRIHARSIMLSAPVEGLIAKLDLLELEGTVATPVVYKRGRAPKMPEGAYEPERVQLCAQGLILRENGFQCDEGVLYFIESKKRVVIPFDDELIARTRQLLAEFRIIAAGSNIPAPLVDSPKCPRCSLVGICLPDEVVFLQAGGGRDFGLAVQESIDSNNEDVSEANLNKLSGEDFPVSSHVPPPPLAVVNRLLKRRYA